jgi:predicted  nucleic acid-binding Zn-ribbon protein
MKIDTTIEDITALIKLAEADAGADHRQDRVDLTTCVPPQILSIYLRLSNTGRKPAIAAIVGGSCAGCHIRLPTMLAQSARRSPALHRCPQCMRMLYAPELLQQKPTASTAEEAAKPTAERRPRKRR